MISFQESLLFYFLCRTESNVCIPVTKICNTVKYWPWQFIVAYKYIKIANIGIAELKCVVRGISTNYDIGYVCSV